MSINEAVIKKLVTGLVLESKKLQDPICEPCLAGKMHTNPFSTSYHCTSAPLELVHSDVHNVNHHTFMGYRYWVMFINDYSRYRFVFPIRKKSEVLQTFKNFEVYAKNQSGHHIETLHDDKGSEYVSNELEQFAKSCRITWQHTVQNFPLQNGIGERANWSISERITAMLDEAGLPKIFWGECLAALVHIWNRCPTKTMGGTTPYQLWHR